MYRVFWVNAWRHEDDEPDAIGVQLTAEPVATLREAQVAASILGPAAEYHYGDGEIVVVDERGRRVNPHLDPAAAAQGVKFEVDVPEEILPGILATREVLGAA